jgi:hypothetical protein
MPSSIAFLPYVRRGLATGITRLEGQSPNETSATFDVQVTLGLATPASPSATQTASASVGLIGPGDIIALHADTIVRVTPGRDESDAEFKHFVAIEFDQADLPWRYTPVAPTGTQLRPWLVLLVLSETDDKFDFPPPTAADKLPVLTIHQGTPLPDLANDSWSWAHLQFHGTVPTTPAGAADTVAIENILRTDPSRTVTRLLSNRVLAPRTPYHAFLVPAFAHGAQVGLGQPIDTSVDVMHTAFDPNPSGDVTLPVYYDWRFQTGAVGKFDDLVKELVPVPIDQSAATRDLDVSVPGYQLPSGVINAPTALPIGGALRPLPPQTPPPPPANPPTVSPNFITQLSQFIGTSTNTVVNSDPLVTPPLYGRWFGAQTGLDAPTDKTNPPWFFHLNSDPRNRTTAALGTSVIQQLQQDLMASAWRQLGSLLPANIERRTLQVGRESFIRMFQRHITSGNVPEIFLILTGLLHGRVLSGSGSTIYNVFTGSKLGRHLFEPQWRRFTRRRGKIGRAQGRLGGPDKFTPLTTLNNPSFDPAPEPPTPDGMATNVFVYGDLVPASIPSIDGLVGLGSNTLLLWGILLFCVSRRFLAANAGVNWWWLLRVMRFGLGLIRLANGRTTIDIGRAIQNGTLTQTQVTNGPVNPTFAASEDETALPPTLQLTPTASTGADSADAKNFRTALGQQINETFFTRLAIPVLPVLAQSVLDAIRAALLAALQPGTSLLASITKRLTQLPTGFVAPADPLQPIQAAPDFPQPVWSNLRDISPSWILPGLQGITPNSVGLCVPNQPFIEAFMVGLNHEMSRELLWNQYPTDQQGTYLRQFWDVTGNQTGTAGSRESIVHINTWGQFDLGQNAPATADPNGILVLLVRGDVIRRYPNVVVYASNAVNNLPADGTEQFPFFTGQLGPDVAFYGFTIDPATANGRFFVLQEQPAEPRFDYPDGTDPKATPYFSAAAAKASTTSVDFAIATFQQPIRVAVLGSSLTPPRS